MKSEKVRIQGLKGLLAGWKSISKSFKDKGHTGAANIIDGCISDLEAFVSIDSDLEPLLKKKKDPNHVETN